MRSVYKSSLSNIHSKYHIMEKMTKRQFSYQWINLLIFSPGTATLFSTMV